MFQKWHNFKLIINIILLLLVFSYYCTSTMQQKPQIIRFMSPIKDSVYRHKMLKISVDSTVTKEIELLNANGLISMICFSIEKYNAINTTKEILINEKCLENEDSQKDMLYNGNRSGLRGSM